MSKGLEIMKIDQLVLGVYFFTYMIFLLRIALFYEIKDLKYDHQKIICFNSKKKESFTEIITLIIIKSGPHSVPLS